MTASAKISTLVLDHIANGMDPIAALKLVCGNALVDQMISDLYDALRAKG